ncbi:MAG: PilN domain-containing protein, partial [Gemmatirosa sp.]
AERGEPAFAVSREQVRRWIAAFEQWAPVESVEPAPTALARALAIGTAPTDGEHRLPAAADEEGVVQVRGGRVTSVRRAPRWNAGDDASDAITATGASRVALGAALGVDGAPAAVQLLPDDLAHGVSRRRAAAVTRAAALCGLAVGLALAAADRQRERRAMALERALRAELPRAAAAESLQARLTAFDDATRAAAVLAARRADPLAALGALGERLPEGATITALRMEGDAWTVEGTARDAAALVPRLAADARLVEVRALAPSTRFVERGTPTETFSIAVRAVGGAR